MLIADHDLSLVHFITIRLFFTSGIIYCTLVYPMTTTCQKQRVVGSVRGYYNSTENPTISRIRCGNRARLPSPVPGLTGVRHRLVLGSGSMSGHNRADELGLLGTRQPSLKSLYLPRLSSSSLLCYCYLLRHLPHWHPPPPAVCPLLAARPLLLFCPPLGLILPHYYALYPLWLRLPPALRFAPLVVCSSSYDLTYAFCLLCSALCLPPSARMLRLPPYELLPFSIHSSAHHSLCILHSTMPIAAPATPPATLML